MENNLEEKFKEIDKENSASLDFKTEFSESELRKAESDIFTDSKTLSYPKIGTITIRFPTVKINSEVDRYFSEVFTDLVMNSSLLIDKKMKVVLEEKGIWTNQDEEEINRLQDLYISKSVSYEQIRLKKRKSDEDKKNMESLEKERSEVYAKFTELTVQRTILFENTIEKKAEQQALYYKITKCVYKEDATLMWSSLDDFLKFETFPDFEKFLADCIIFWRGVPSPFYGSSPVQLNGKENIN